MCALQAPHPFYISTSGQSQDIDRRTIKEFGINSFTLMETAGYSAAQKLLEKIEPGSRGVYLCGKGNNAGDALVVARYLIQHGHEAALVFISGTDDLSADTQTNYRLLQKISENDPDAAPLTVAGSWNEFDRYTEADFIIDGMLGTGLTSDVRGDYTDAVGWANRKTVPVYAIDIPTGLHGDTGKIMGHSVKADGTYSFGTLKQGFYLNDGPTVTGTVSYCELPFPNYLKHHCTSFLIDEAWIRHERKESARHKYEAGVLYVLAGSEGLTGAAMLACQSAWAVGIGAVILVCPHGTLDIYEENLPQIIKKPVGNRDDYHFKAGHLDSVMAILSEKEGVALIGPGIGRKEDTQKFVLEFLATFKGEAVIDADGLWSLSRQANWEKPDAASWLLTPHPGELSTLLQVSVNDDHERLRHVAQLSKDKKVTVISKGYPVIIGTADGKTYLTSYDTRRFSRAGFGDILAGTTGAYRALGHDADKSAALALLRGKEISDTLEQQKPDHTIEPTDFI